MIPINFGTLQNELMGPRVVDVFCDRNSEGDVCELTLMLEDGTDLKIKTAGNLPLVFEMQESD